MERLQRALELARAQRGAVQDSLALRELDADADFLATATIRPMPRPADTGTQASTDAAGHGSATASPAVRFLAPVDRRSLERRRLVFPDDPGPAALAYRMLRTQLLQQAATHGLKTIGVVSALDGEGASLTAVNLALSIAGEPGQSVVLADFDQRRPSLATLLGLSTGVGLEAHFRDGTDLGEIATGLIGIPGLVVVPRFAPAGATTESFAAPRTRALLATLRGLAGQGLLLLDLPAALLCDDVLAISPMLDGVVVVAAARRTRRADFTRVDQMLGGARVVGTVLNRSDEAERRGDPGVR